MFDKQSFKTMQQPKSKFSAIAAPRAQRPELSHFGKLHEFQFSSFLDFRRCLEILPAVPGLADSPALPLNVNALIVPDTAVTPLGAALTKEGIVFTERCIKDGVPASQLTLKRSEAGWSVS